MNINSILNVNNPVKYIKWDNITFDNESKLFLWSNLFIEVSPGYSYMKIRNSKYIEFKNSRFNNITYDSDYAETSNILYVTSEGNDEVIISNISVTNS